MKKYFPHLIFGSLVALAVSLVTSTSLLALSHILILIPLLYFLNKTHYTEFPKSAWALLVLALFIILSVVFTQDIAMSGYKPISKVKYFLFGFFMIAPYSFYFKNHITNKKIAFLVYAIGVATSVASIAGYIGMRTGYNYVSMRSVNTDRNAGLSGMVLNYAHNLAYFQILLLGLIIYKKEINQFINEKFLYFIFVLNLLGLYFSYTRGAIIALLAGIPFYFYKKNKVKFLRGFGLLIILGSIIYFASGSSLIRTGSDNERLSQWKAALYAFKERPIWGYGYLNFERYSVSIKEKYNIGQLQFGGHAHNNFLEMLASTGILGFLAFVTWLFFWVREMYERNDLAARLCFPFIVTFVVSGLTQSTISLGINLFFIMAVYAIGQASAKNYT